MTGSVMHHHQHHHHLSSPARPDAETFQFRGASNKKPYTFASQPQALSVAARTAQIDTWVVPARRRPKYDQLKFYEIYVTKARVINITV